MRFDCGPTWQERKEKLCDWHSWYAWYPVRVGPRECRWLERVERKGEYWFAIGGSGWTWEYRVAA